MTTATIMSPSIILNDENLKQLKSAYRHPFEFISPNLYMKENSNVKNAVDSRNTMTPELAAQDFGTAFFFDNENEFDLVTSMMTG